MSAEGRIRGAIAGLSCSLLLAGCGDAKLHVQSDTSWAGAMGTYAGTVQGFNDSLTVNDSGQRIAIIVDSAKGSGNQTFDLGTRPFCWSFSKQTAAGTLRVYIGSGSLEPGSNEAATSAAFGTVSGCVT